MSKILLIEDDDTIALSITFLLKQEGYKVITCSNISESKSKLLNNDYSIILLDISLPDGNGYDLCKYIKEKYNLPIIMITAKDSERDIIKGFDFGADDYITKPFKAGELISRIKNIIKRYQGINDEEIIINNIKIDTKNYMIYKNDKIVELTPLEYKILLTLFQNKDIVLTREQILSNIWDSNDVYVNDNTLTVYIKRIREKIEKDSDNPKIIKTVRGIGYKVGE
jgi:DNA-binding response OmpR family regulator